MSFNKILKQLRLGKNLTQAELAEVLGISKSSISMYEQGNREPDFETEEAIADFFNVNLNYLRGKAEENHSIPLPKNIHPVQLKKIPLLGEIACGVPIFTNEDKESYMMVGANIQADFCLICKGDSMIDSRIYDGDVVFIQETNQVDNGQIAAIIIGDEATLKRVYYYPEEAKLILNPANPKYPPLVYVGRELEEIKILGRAIAFQSNLI